MFSLSRKLPQIKQSGFAIIPMLVLLIVGIATGVYLIQTQTNLFPQASTFTACSIEDITSKKATFSHCDVYNIPQARENPSRIQDFADCDSYLALYPNPKNALYCKTDATAAAADPASPVKPCTYTDINSGATFSHCDYKDEKGLGEARCKSIFIQNKPNDKPMPDGFSLFCKQTATAPAATSPEVSKKCSDTELAKCAKPNKGCYIIDERIRCVYEKATCSQKDIEFCQDPSDGDPREGCEVGNATTVEGQTKTPVQYTKCTAAKRGSGTPAAGSQTEVPDTKCADPNHPVCTTNSSKEYGVDKGICYMINSNLRCAYSKDYKSYDSANGPCNAEDNKACKSKGGCTLVSVKIKGQSDPIQYSICKNDTAARPAAAPAAAPAAGTGPKPGAPAAATPPNPRPGSATQPAAAAQAAAPKPAGDLICGKDSKGIDIPCYAMGVFSADELSQREAQATLASVNYAKFTDIINREESRVGETIANNARAKIAAAEKEVKACLEKK